MKKLGYYLFAVMFYFFRLFGQKDDKVFCIMTHDGSEDSSVGTVVKALKDSNREYRFFYMRKDDREEVKKHKIKKFISFFIYKPYHMATSSYIMLDNAFLPMAYIKFSDKVKVIQLWHGTGTIKKFGQDVNTGELKILEARANKNITHLIVNSEYTKRQYSQAFGIPLDRVYVWGLPRTDELFHLDKRGMKSEVFYNEYPELKGKKLILYAPTFRDSEVLDPKMKLDISSFLEGTDGNTVLLLKFHPFVARNFHMYINSERVINVSTYKDINTLLYVSDILITDYSSIIFEYSVLKKPMIFYAYDLESFSDQGRGFYEPYEEYVPGPIVTTTKELVEVINQDSWDMKRINTFLEKSFTFLDGDSTNRLIKRVFMF